MSEHYKPRITTAAVVAAHDVLDRSEMPANYFKVSCQEQRNMRMAVVLEALIAAELADRRSPPSQPRASP